MSLIRYWFKFDISLEDSPPLGVIAGCGVSANNYDDAIDLIKKKIFKNDPLPEIVKYTENIDISTLDKNHVLPNMGNHFVRGIWYPLGYL